MQTTDEQSLHIQPESELKHQLHCTALAGACSALLGVGWEEEGAVSEQPCGLQTHFRKRW